MYDRWDVIPFGAIEQVNIALRSPLGKIDQIQGRPLVQRRDGRGDFRAVAQPVHGFGVNRHARIETRNARDVNAVLDVRGSSAAGLARDDMDFVPERRQPVCFQKSLRTDSAFGGFGRIFLRDERDSHATLISVLRSPARLRGEWPTLRPTLRTMFVPPEPARRTPKYRT